MPLLFSYGTLQQREVQQSTFGRDLDGQHDQLVGFARTLIQVADAEFARESGSAFHAIVTFTGDTSSRVDGVVFDVTDEELARSDSYEPVEYQRQRTVLASGKSAWVYAAAR